MLRSRQIQAIATAQSDGDGCRWCQRVEIDARGLFLMLEELLELVEAIE
jgi:hypothetical protein